MNRDSLMEVSILLIFFAFALFGAGAIDGKGNGCKYSTIASRISIPYVIGCELFKERWK